jgi:peptidoglycan/xylan/chitin deacetylase (PgdA/CDA1 family)
MPHRAQTLPILTYHSISEEPGPTSIPPSIFSAQMESIAGLGVDVVSLEVVEKWLDGEAALERRTVAITFDDAFADFKLAAFPVLSKFGFTATVFAPTSAVGGSENWDGANDAARALMSWDDISELASQNIAFGSHTRRHCDLTTIDANELDDELAESRRELEERLGKPAPYFAPPYGRSNPKVRSAIAERYALSVGVRLGEARRDSPRHDLPRIEMHYYRDISRWREFLRGDGGAYLTARRAARAVRETISGALRATAG